MNQILLLTFIYSSTLIYAAELLGADVCNQPTTLKALIQDGQRHIRDLKIAKTRGDLVGMGEAFGALHTGILKNCSEEEKAAICGYECHFELAEYHLFMASEISYYYSKSASSIDSPLLKQEELAAHVIDGLEIVKSGTKALSYQNKDLRDFFNQVGKFNLLKAKLLMAAGDNFYQGMSRSRIDRMNYVMGSVIDPDTPKPQNIQDARAYYRDAHWTIQEAMMDTPETSEFDSLNAEIRNLAFKLARRMDSLDKGYLFLGVDPEHFTALSVDQLRTELRTLGARIGTVEEKIDLTIQSWLTTKANHDTATLNNSMREQELNIAKSSYRIAKMNDAATEFSNDISTQISSLQSLSAGIEYEIRREQMTYQLKMKLKELESRTRLISTRKEVDILSFEENSLVQDISDLRWMMNWSIALANLDLQVSTFESQIKEHEGQVRTKRSEQTKLENSKLTASENIKISGERILTARELIKSLKLQKKDIFNADKSVIDSQICKTMIKMVNLNGEILQPYIPPDCTLSQPSVSQESYEDFMCKEETGLRHKLQEQKIETVTQTLCTIGVDALPEHIKNDENLNLQEECQGISVIEKAQEIFTKEQNLALERSKNLGEQRRRLKSHIDTIINNFDDAQFLRSKLKSMQVTAETALLASASLPDTAKCACGMSSGIKITTKPAQAATAAYNIFSNALNHGIDWISFVNQNQEMIDRLKLDLASISDRYEEQRFQEELQNLHALKAVMEIKGNAQDIGHEIQGLLIEDDMIQMDCDSAASDLLENIALTRETYRGLLAQLDSLTLNNVSIDSAIAEQESHIRTQESLIVIEEANIENIGISIASLEDEIGVIQSIKADVDSRKSLVTNLKANVQGLELEAERKKQALEELKSLKLSKTIALSDEELSQVETVINEDSSFTPGLVKNINELKDLGILSADLQSELGSFQESLASEIALERESMLNYVDNQLSTLPESDKIFLASQEELAALARGVPEFINSKKHLVERANQYLALLRYKTGALLSLASKTPFTDPSLDTPTFIRTRAELSDALDMIDDEFWSVNSTTHESQIFINRSRITIPNSSGFARSLSENHEVSFEISPEGQNPQLGHYAIWSSDFDSTTSGGNQNLLLVDFHMVVDFEQTDCISRKVALKHLGYGYVFKQMSENDPTLVPMLRVHNERVKTPAYETQKDTAGSLLDKAIEYWKSDHYIQSFLTVAPPNEPGQAVVPLMGMPLIGSYKMKIEPPSEGCSYEEATFILHFFYSTDFKID